ncbi:MAG: hypothetical protein F6K10_41675 [Moorea sp. SIO2B7]|nr:hypothetical protein [Moorena sp. SIO2B7]
MLQGPRFLVTFLYYFSCTTVIVVVIASQIMGLSLEAKLPYQFGILFGLVAGLLGANFNRSVTISTSFRNKKVFTKTLNEALYEMGFEESTQVDEFTVYQKSALRTLFSGKVFVQIDNNSATIISRSSIIKRLSQKI